MVEKREKQSLKIELDYYHMTRRLIVHTPPAWCKKPETATQEEKSRMTIHTTLGH
jgi:hypothetical protein